MAEWFIALVMFSGAFFIFLASVGVLRMPDLFLRMSATSKAATLGAGLMLGATALSFGEFSVATRAIATIVFLLITTPVAAHMIARAAYFDGAPLSPGTLRDELRGHYHLTDHALDSVVQDSSDTWIPEIEGDDFPEVR